jgi:DNA-binding transcriptional regulator YhcF (GntR family)
MNIRLDLRSDIPIYIQIVEQVRQSVASGVLKPGDQLPTVRALASDLRVNFNTVARAYRLLDDAGIISTQQGRGTYILDEPAAGIDEHLRLASLGALARRFLEESSRLGFSAKQAIEHLEKQVNDTNSDS